ncbi:MAG TPA: group II truncated hemoglobin [Gemmatimonadaceae bacterium]|nr:group II truncated hemoglobin [Gemmatimonadaceae bacterium]
MSDAVRQDSLETLSAAASSPPSLYDWAGGLPALERLTTVFYDRVLADALLAPVFAQMGPEHPKYVARFLAEVFRGPALYTAERGGHATMLSHHLARRLTQEQRARWVQLLLASADAAGLPDDPEFRSAFVAYLEWGSRLAVLNSQEGAAPQLEQPMPSWGWGEVGGPYRP